MERREEEKGLVASLVVPTLGRLRHEGQCMFPLLWPLLVPEGSASLYIVTEPSIPVQKGRDPETPVMATSTFRCYVQVTCSERPSPSS